MAVTGFHVETNIDDSNITVYTTGSRTPTANRLQLIDIQLSDTNPVLAPTVTGCGLTWVAVGSGVEYDTAGTRHAIFRFRALGASPTTGQLTITATEAMSGCGWSWNEYDGIDTGGTNGSAAIVQTVTNSGVGTTLSATLAAFGSVNNGVAAGFSTDADSVYTAGSGYTILGQDVSASASPTASIGQEWRADNDTSPDATIGVSATWGIIASELKAAAAPTTGATAVRLYGRPEIPATTVGLATRGGASVLAMLPYSSLSYGRRLDDMSDASVTVPWNDCEGALGTALATVNPWEHEIIVWRGTEQVWVGPVQTVEWSDVAVQIRARDLFQWLEHRILGRNGDASVNQDLADTFVGMGADGIGSDLPGPVSNDVLMEFRNVDCGTTAFIFTAAQDMRYAADEMRALAATCVDWTMVGRTVWAGGEDFIAGITSAAGHAYKEADGTFNASVTLSGSNLPVSPTAPLITEHVDQARIERSPQATYVVVRGAMNGPSDDQAFAAAGSQPLGTAGGINDATLGTVDLVETNSSLRDDGAATAAATARKAVYGGPQLVCRWLVDSSVRFHHLIPGALIPVAVQVGCKFLDQDMRLAEVAVQVSGGDEIVTLRLGPVSS